MKKYSILLVYLMVFGLALSSSLARAEDGTGARGNLNLNVNMNGGSRENAKVGLDAKLKLEADRKAANSDWQKQREEMRAKMEAERKAFSDKLKADRDAFKASVEKEKADFKTANADRKREFWNKVGEVLSTRFTVAITAIENAQVRVADRIVKLDVEGKDTTEIKADLDLSKSKLADAKAKLAEIKAILPASGEQITAEVFAQIKVKAREAKDLIKESVENLKAAIKLIKGFGDVKLSTEVEGHSDTNVEGSN